MLRKLFAVCLLLVMHGAMAGILTLCIEPWPPFIYPDSRGIPAGIAGDAFVRAAALQGHRVKYVYLSAGACQRLMNEGRVEALAFALAKDSPPAWVQTKEPLVYWVLNAWVAKSSPLLSYPGLDYFKGRRVAYVRAYDYPENIRIKKDWTRIETSDTTTAVRLLAVGRVDVIFEDAVAMMGMAPSLGEKIRRLQPVMASVPQPFSFAPEWQKLRDEVDRQAVQMKASGELDRFYLQYFDRSFAQVVAGVK